MNKLITVIIASLILLSTGLSFAQTNYNFEYKKLITLDSTESHNDFIDRVELFVLSTFKSPKDVILYKNERLGVYKISGVITEDYVPTGFPQTITTKWSFQIIIMKIDGVSVMKVKNVKNYDRYVYKWQRIHHSPKTYLSWTRYEENVPKPRKMYSKKQKVLREVFKIHRQFQKFEHDFKYFMTEDINNILSNIIK